MEISVKYGTQKLVCDLARADRKTLKIEVHPDLSIHIKAPVNASLSDIEQKVQKRSRWILKQQLYFEQFLPRTPKREYVSGESHLYLGRQYLLKVRESNINSVKLIGGELRIYVREHSNNNLVKHLLTEWYFKHSKIRLEEAINKYLPYFKEFKVDKPPLKIKRMPKRWGSCTPKGKIILNPELIKTPSKCIEYVVIHELCHLVHHNHNKDFYNLQKRIMPDWERWKSRLETISA